MFIFQTCFLSPIGPIQLTFNDHYLTRVELFHAGNIHQPKAPSAIGAVIKRIQGYFDKPQRLDDIDFQLVPHSSFVGRVLEEMLAIKLGETRTYGDIAKRLKTSPRAVGNACGHNPLALVIPCHRVVGANGIGGFFHTHQGAPIEAKEWLLAHERKTC